MSIPYLESGEGRSLAHKSVQDCAVARVGPDQLGPRKGLERTRSPVALVFPKPHVHVHAIRLFHGPPARVFRRSLYKTLLYL